MKPGVEPRRVRPKYRSRAAARARRKLAFYMLLALPNPRMGGGWLSELRSIVDDIIHAAVEAVRDEALASLGAEVIAHRALRHAWTETRAENDRLRAEVERLRAAPATLPNDPAGGEP